MPVEVFRVVTDRWEWASIAKLVPTIYHEQSWTLATVARLRSQFSLPVSFGYVRVWVDNTLVGCPLVQLGDRWFNTPRATPMVLRGVNLNATAALLRAIERQVKVPMELDLHDDSELVAQIDRTRAVIAARTAATRKYRTVTDRELATIVPGEWVEALRTTWRAGDWTTYMLRHFDDHDEPVGVTVWVDRPCCPPECIAAVHVAALAPHSWTVSR